MDLFEKALDLDSEYVPAYLGKAYVYGLQENFEEGEISLLQAKQIDPDDNRIEEMLKELNKMKPGSDDESIENGKNKEENEGEEKEENEKNEGEEEKEENEKEDGKEEVIEDDKEIVIEAPNQPVAETIPLLVENGVMTEQFYQTLVIIFSHFDKESKDGAWNAKELDAFFLQVNGSPPDSATKQFIKKKFQVNKKGWLTIEGFMQLYLSQTAGGPEETWKDMQRLGFDQYLKPIPKTGIFQ